LGVGKVEKILYNVTDKFIFGYMDLDRFQGSLQKCLDHLHEDLASIHTGRAAPELVESVLVKAYEVTSPLKSVANISISDAKSLVIQPWDKSILENILKAITDSNLGFLPSIEGEIVRVKIPDLTEERRKEFVKVMKERVEEARISVRNVRQEFMKEIDSNVSSGLSEDEGKRMKNEVEKRVKEMNEEIENTRDKKEKELMTI